MKSKPVAPYVVAVICSLVVILIAYAFFFVPKLNQTADLDQKVAATEISNEALQTKATVLKNKVAHLSEATAQVAAFEKSFPSDASQQDLIASILDAASGTGVTVTGVNPAAPAPVTAADPAASPPPTTPAVPAASGDPGTAAGTPTPAVPTDFSKVLAAVPLTINASGDPGALVAFMKKIDSLKRPFTVTEVTLVSAADGSGLLTLTGQSFLTAPLPAPSKTPEAGASAPASAPADPSPTASPGTK